MCVLCVQMPGDDVCTCVTAPCDCNIFLAGVSVVGTDDGYTDVEEMVINLAVWSCWSFLHSVTRLLESTMTTSLEVSQWEGVSVPRSLFSGNHMTGWTWWGDQNYPDCVAALPLPVALRDLIEDYMAMDSMLLFWWDIDFEIKVVPDIFEEDYVRRTCLSGKVLSEKFNFVSTGYTVDGGKCTVTTSMPTPEWTRENGTVEEYGLVIGTQTRLHFHCDHPDFVDAPKLYADAAKYCNYV